MMAVAGAPSPCLQHEAKSLMPTGGQSAPPPAPPRHADAVWHPRLSQVAPMDGMDGDPPADMTGLPCQWVMDPDGWCYAAARPTAEPVVTGGIGRQQGLS